MQIKDAIGTDSDIFADYPSYISDLKPAGYAYITTNGDHNVNAYSYVNVNVPQGGAAILGNLSVSENGQYSASSYSYDGFDVVNVNVPTVTPVLNSLSVYANGVYTPQTGVDGFNEVTVNVPATGGHSGTSATDAWTIDEAISYISAFEDTAEHIYTDLGFIPYVEGVIAAVRNTRSAQYPSARYTITRTGESIAADYSNAIVCWNINPAIGQGTWTEGVDRQVKVGDHVIIAADKLQKYYDSNNDVYQMEFKNGAEIQAQSQVANTLTVSQSGTYDVQNYVSAYVNVPSGTTPDIMDESVQLNGKVVTLSYQYSFIQDPEMGETTTRVLPLLALKNVDSDTNYGAYTYLCNAPKEVTGSYVVSDMYLSTNNINQYNDLNGVVINTTGGSGHTDLNDEYYTGSEVSRDWFINSMDKAGYMKTKYQYLKISGNDPYMDPAYCYIFNKKIFGDIVDPYFAYGATVQIVSNSDDPWVESYSQSMGMKENDCFVKYATDVAAVYTISDGWKLYKGYDISGGTLISDNWNLTQDSNGYYVQVHVYNGTQTSDRTFFITGNIGGNECYYGASYQSFTTSAFEKHTGRGKFQNIATHYEAPDADGIFEISINQTTLECTFKFTPDA
ncbi:MAG: hypothetical protein IKH71_04960 [Oscillospiraceae bacterium]|nr:hypothetical protein [Oscillospiraceae bacterium]